MMNLESQVTSLELSKRLKELGVQQESLFHWYVSERSGYSFILESKEVNYCVDSQDKYEVYSAFTASELLELLPDWSNLYKREKNDYTVQVYEKDSDINHNSFDENPCNALAKMLIHLIENNFLEYKTP